MRGRAPLRAVVAGGCGRVGRLFTEALAPVAAVTVVDLAGAPASHGSVTVRQGDVRSPDRELRRCLAGADTVVLALPEDAALAAVEVVAGAVRPGALLADTCSAKARLVHSLAEHGAAAGIECVSVSPMFAPELGFPGRPVALVPVRPGPRCEWFGALLEAAGARVVPICAADYDEVVSAVQVATHAALLSFGQTLRRRGIALERLMELGTPPFHLLLLALARVTSAPPLVYRDIQAAGEAAASARADLQAAVAELGVAALAVDPASFAAFVSQIADWMGPHRRELSSRCASLFEVFGIAAGAPAADPPTEAPVPTRRYP